MPKSRLLGAIVLTAVAVAAAQAAGAGAASGAEGDVSSNWAGYVVNGLSAMAGAPTSFSSVSGAWTEPAARCGSAGEEGISSSAFWVGLGGNSDASPSLEQIGTEADCGPAGFARYSAWYELVPAASAKIKLPVSPGDKLSASVSVDGTRVTVRMANLTRGRSFTRTLRMTAPDTTSAEWITEAPSVCADTVNCRQIALTNFGTVAFSDARATSAGHTGPVSDTAWISTPVSLEARGGGFGVGRFGPQISAAEAVPTALGGAGGRFSVTWSGAEPRSGSGYGSGLGYAGTRRR